MTTKSRAYPTRVEVTFKRKAGWIVLDQICTVDKRRLVKKLGTITGNPDLLLLNEFMRDELDNTTELIEVLEQTGLDLVCHSETKDEEDTFKLGPDLIEQLRKKMKIMRDHWLDAGRYLATPHK